MQRIRLLVSAVLLCATIALAQPITYYIQGLHRQPDAATARAYLGITSGVASNAFESVAGAGILISTNVPNHLYTFSAAGTLPQWALLPTNSVPGPPGPAGPSGTNGLNGINGTNGLNGVNGTNGVSGTNGLNGVNGTNATITITNTLNGAVASVTNLGTAQDAILQFTLVNGTNGINGTNGLNGLNGTNAASGLVTNDFTITIGLSTNDFATTNWATTNFYPLTSNPSNYLTAAAVGAPLYGTNIWTGTNTFSNCPVIVRSNLLLAGSVLSKVAVTNGLQFGYPLVSGTEYYMTIGKDSALNGTALSGMQYSGATLSYGPMQFRFSGLGIYDEGTSGIIWYGTASELERMRLDPYGSLDLGTGTSLGGTTAANITTTNSVYIKNKLVVAEERGWYTLSVSNNITTNFIVLNIATNTGMAVTINYGIVSWATNRTDIDCHQGRVYITAVNVGGVITLNTPVNEQEDGRAKSHGVAVTDTFTQSSGTSNVTVSINLNHVPGVVTNHLLRYWVRHSDTNSVGTFYGVWTQ